MYKHPFNGHTRAGNTMGSLEQSQYCPVSEYLSTLTGRGRSALMSQAWHAALAGQPDAAEKMARLTPDEREQVKGWGCPTDVVIPGAEPLRYHLSEQEIPLGLDDFGFYVDPRESDVLTRGYADFGWCIDHPSGQRIAYVGDLKRQAHTADGPWILQLQAYGFAYAQREGATAFCTGLWLGEERVWQWGDIVQLGTPAADALLERVLFAARNKSTDPRDVVYGPHCGSCYGWRACPAYSLPPREDLPDSWDGITGDKAAEYLIEIERQMRPLEEAKENIKRLAKEGLPIIHGNKVYKAIRCAGRRSVRIEDVEEKAPGLIRHGEPTTQVRWVNR